MYNTILSLLVHFATEKHMIMWQHFLPWSLYPYEPWKTVASLSQGGSMLGNTR